MSGIPIRDLLYNYGPIELLMQVLSSIDAVIDELEDGEIRDQYIEIAEELDLLIDTAPNPPALQDLS